MQSQMFLNNSPSYPGTQEFQHPNLSYRTRQRLIEEVRMRKAAKNKNDLRAIVNNILHQNIGQLAAYVQAAGEAPNQKPDKLILQAALIRLNEVKDVARGFDLSDDNATLLIEDEDSQMKQQDLPGAEYLPDPQVLAALKMVYDTLKKQFQTDSVGVIATITGANNFDNFQPSFSDIVDQVDDFGFNNEYYKDQDRVICDVPIHYNNWDSSGITAFDPTRYNALDPATQQDVKTSNDGNVFNFVDKIVNSITAVGGAVQNQANQTAAQSFAYALKQNLPLILGIIVVLGLVIYLSIHAAKNK